MTDEELEASLARVRERYHGLAPGEPLPWTYAGQTFVLAYPELHRGASGQVLLSGRDLKQRFSVILELPDAEVPTLPDSALVQVMTTGTAAMRDGKHVAEFPGVITRVEPVEPRAERYRVGRAVEMSCSFDDETEGKWGFWGASWDDEQGDCAELSWDEYNIEGLPQRSGWRIRLTGVVARGEDGDPKVTDVRCAEWMDYRGEVPLQPDPAPAPPGPRRGFTAALLARMGGVIARKRSH